MNALAIHLYLTITFINLVIIRLAQNYRIIVNISLNEKKKRGDKIEVCRRAMFSCD